MLNQNMTFKKNLKKIRKISLLNPVGIRTAPTYTMYYHWGIFQKPLYKASLFSNPILELNLVSTELLVYFFASSFEKKKRKPTVHKTHKLWRRRSLAQIQQWENLMAIHVEHIRYLIVMLQFLLFHTQNIASFNKIN